MELRTITEALDRAADRKDAGFTFVRDDASERTFTYADLALATRRIAAALQQLGVRKGERVALVLPTADEFVPAFLGVVRSGAIPVPLYPPLGMGQLGGYLDHAKHIVGAARASVVLTNTQIKAVLGKLHNTVPELRLMLTMAELEGDASLFREPGATAEDTCFLQFTSGSTSRPKGVIVTHANLSHNCHAVMRDGLASDDADRGVSWLPLFHDMGLIGFVLAPIHHIVPVTFMSPLMFLKRPASWLEYLSKHRGTITYGPNFSYAITAKRVRDSELEGLDLSCVRVAGCGAEPIQADTLRAFAKRFGAVGFRAEAFVPSYGMAENTLAIAFAKGIVSDVVAAEALWSEGQATPRAASAEAETVEIVGCGKAFPEHEIRIVDAETRKPLGERRVGEIQVRGPSVMPGYYEQPERTVEVVDPEGWLSTGDLGYLASDAIYICGRKKDVIIVNGKNYYPQDLEWVANEVEGIRAGNAIAFASHRAGLNREAVVVVAETREAEGREELARKVSSAIAQSTGLTVDDVAIVDVGTIPKTSSGKLQRAHARTGALRARRATAEEARRRGAHGGARRRVAARAPAAAHLWAAQLRLSRFSARAGRATFVDRCEQCALERLAIVVRDEHAEQRDGGDRQAHPNDLRLGEEVRAIDFIADRDRPGGEAHPRGAVVGGQALEVVKREDATVRRDHRVAAADDVIGEHEIDVAFGARDKDPSRGFPERQGPFRGAPPLARRAESRLHRRGW